MNPFTIHRIYEITDDYDREPKVKLSGKERRRKRRKKKRT